MQTKDLLEKHFRLNDSQKQGLHQLGIKTIGDLIYHFPSRYESIDQIKRISEVQYGDQAIIYGKIFDINTGKNLKNKTPFAEAKLDDGTGKLKVIWFNQPYIAKSLNEDTPVKIFGRIGGKGKNLYVANPEFEILRGLPADPKGSLFEDIPAEEQNFFPIYPESRGITSKWFYHKIKYLFSQGILEELKDPIPESILKRYNLPSLKTALIWIHMPKESKHSFSARKRFAFEEVFYIQLLKGIQRKEMEERNSLKIDIDEDAIEEFVKTFPFPLTGSQRKAVEEIVADFKNPQPMRRLLEGDVGSGKTAVAAATVYAIASTRPPGQNFGSLQTAYMVPTEVLAAQHFESFIKYFSHLPIKIGLLTSNRCQKFPSKVNPQEPTNILRNQLLKWVANGEIPILVGTHSLIQKKVQFKNLAYVIIDEQHRFGTVQRKELTRKDEKSPHLLSMTATPIPRTLALTIYGDLDISTLKEMPTGRKQAQTEIVPPNKRGEMYEKIRKELAEGKQAYILCPRIEEPDPEKQQALYAKSVKEETQRLQKEVFTEHQIEMLHGKLKPQEKEEVMKRFQSGETQILVTTSVIEVGVDVPSATMIVIEGAERFGLAQLHQLRGRVIRSTHQPYCFVFTESRSKKVIERLKALKTAKNGFELAEYDLAQRGVGELYGRKQWGISDIGMEAIRNVDMVEAARKEAGSLIENDPDLAEHLELKESVNKKQQDLHFE